MHAHFLANATNNGNDKGARVTNLFRQKVSEKQLEVEAAMQYTSCVGVWSPKPIHSSLAQDTADAMFND